MSDPTRIDLVGSGDSDPRVRRMTGWTQHGNMRIDVPFMTEVLPGLWHGGVETGLILPDFIDAKLSLFKWEDYIYPATRSVDTLTVTMYDSNDQTFEGIEELANWVNTRRADGETVFVHCQAGLNRSSLVVAKALVMNGDVSNGQEAIDLIRERRSEACLCNRSFEEWVRTL